MREFVFTPGSCCTLCRCPLTVRVHAALGGLAQVLQTAQRQAARRRATARGVAGLAPLGAALVLRGTTEQPCSRRPHKAQGTRAGLTTSD